MHVIFTGLKGCDQHPNVVIKSPAHKAGLFLCYNTNMARKLNPFKQQAILKGEKTYFTGKPCKHGHLAPQTVHSSACVECRRIARRLWGKQPHIQKRDSEKLKLWKKQLHNKPKVAANTRKRQASQLQRTPAWDPDAHLIVAKYQLATMLSQAAGIPHHVDHIIPLQGRKVSGLHVFSNLRVIPGSDNVKKSNKFHI